MDSPVLLSTGVIFAPRIGGESKTDGKFVSIHIVQMYQKQKPVQPPPDERQFVGGRSVGVMVEQTGSMACAVLPQRMRDRENGQMGYSGNDASPPQGFGWRVREGRDTNAKNSTAPAADGVLSAGSHPRGGAYGSYLVDPASSHMLVSKIKPCMSKYKLLIL
jgi:hypothetical protein